MEIYGVENLSFKYAGDEHKVLEDISFSVQKGEFVTFCGASGSGKTTLLRMLKPLIAPKGEISGNIFFNGSDILKLSQREQAFRIGFVMQEAEEQIVTDKVWHELAFGLENLGVESSKIWLKISEAASFFGMDNWFNSDISRLSGGMKQILNLASVMAMSPEVIILDEPTGQLDPVSASEFMAALFRLNRDLGITVIMSEHRLEEALPLSDRLIVLENGKIIANSTPEKVGRELFLNGSKVFLSMTSSMRIAAMLGADSLPVSIREGKEFIRSLAGGSRLISKAKPVYKEKKEELSVSVENIWFRYEKNGANVLKGVYFKAYKGKISAVLGGNGAGKTTLLSVISGIYKPFYGNVFIGGNNIKKNISSVGMLPQNPRLVFAESKIGDDIKDILMDKGFSEQEAIEKTRDALKLCGAEDIYEKHPFDVSGGEAQKAALSKLLAMDFETIIMDEPTKCLDSDFKASFGNILLKLKDEKKTIIIVSHDIEFCAVYADRLSFLFDGRIVSEGNPLEFFTQNMFYTTAASKISRGIIENAVTTEDIIDAFGKHGN
ncbi:MAG: energy-coupling factor transporter ATPase [Lachnospiraceae bacterium]|nr:energy-coupling factor transporter ATPase [Lachnospiraceae bacterium]